MEGTTFYNRIENIDAESKYLIDKAKQAIHLSYAPYSNFQVGAAILLEDNTVVLGGNQENASYPLCMCAERIALYVVASEHRGKKIKKLAVVAQKEHLSEFTGATCCGACRQVLFEFEMRQSSPIEIVMMTSGNRWLIVKSAESLLPYSFSKQDLS